MFNCGPACSTSRPAFCPQESKDPAQTPHALGVAAVKVLKLMLEWDPLDTGQRADVQYAVRALDALIQCLEFDDREYDVIQGQSTMDATTQNWLLTFTHQQRPKRKIRLRDIVNMIRAGMRLKRQNKARKSESFKILPTGSVTTYRDILARVDYWNEFDIFQVSTETDGHPLTATAHAVLDARQLVPSFSLPHTELKTFLEEIEEAYLKTNAYHNALHAADVTQAVHAFLNRGLGKSLTELEVLALTIAAACHDVGHPGVTNDFRVHSQDDDAITYNDHSVNESMHCAIAFRVLKNDRCHFVRPLALKQQQLFRKVMIEAILATDMAFHFSGVEKFKATCKAEGTDVCHWNSTMPLLEVALHAGDLSNVCRPQNLALKWTDAVLQEFFAQGDRERVMGYEVSPLCNRKAVSKANSQIGFINFIVEPLIMAIEPLCDLAEPLTNMQAYLEYWTNASDLGSHESTDLKENSRVSKKSSI